MRRRTLLVRSVLIVAMATGGSMASGAAAPVESTSSFVPITPCRLFDTRAGSDNVGPRSTPLGAGETHVQPVWGANGRCDIPEGATAVAMNVAIVNPTAASFLTVFPDEVARPLAAGQNWVAGQRPTPNAVTAALSPHGRLAFYNLAGSVDLAVDVVGYYEPAGAGAMAGPFGPQGSAGPPGATGPGGAPGAPGPAGVFGRGWGRITTTVTEIPITLISPRMFVDVDGRPGIVASAPMGGIAMVACADLLCTERTLTLSSFGDRRNIAPSLGADGQLWFAEVPVGAAVQLHHCSANGGCPDVPVSIFAGPAVTPALIVRPDGRPIVVFAAVGGELRALSCDDLSCASGHGVALGTGVTPAFRLAGALAPDGRALVVVTDPDRGSVREVVCGDLDCTTVAGTAAVAAGGATDARVAIAPDGAPTILVTSGKTGAVDLIHCSSSSCGTTTVSRLVDASSGHAAFAFDPQGMPVVAYGAGDGVHVLLCGDAACRAGQRSDVVPSFTVPGQQPVDVKIVGDGQPTVLVSDGSVASLVHVGRGSWQPTDWGT